MKLKTSAEAEMPAAQPAAGGGAVIADRFKLDMDDGAGRKAGAGQGGAFVALLGAVASLAALVFVAWMLHQNWVLLQNA